MIYRPSWDLSTIPDNLILSRAGQIRNAQRKTRGAGPGRPKSLMANSANAELYAKLAWRILLNLNNLRENSV